MISITNNSQCCGCGACVNICPAQCVVMCRDEEGFLYPKINSLLCVHCGLCKKVCNYYHETNPRKNKADCFAVKACDDELRENSSSGGVFSLLSNAFLKDGGVVYGVSMDDEFQSCSYVRIIDVNDLHKVRGSKYLQANTNNVYNQVKQDLESGNKVLFSGVPCQMAALRLFLNKEYKNLFCVEVICHGVPSPLLWKKYILYLEKVNQTTVSSVHFRNKKYGWREYSLEIVGNNFYQNKKHSLDPYLLLFSKNLSLRPSCYGCLSKTQDSRADLTIADYWGIGKLLPEMDDDRGISLVMINNEKGKTVFDSIKNSIISAHTPYEFAIAANPAFCSSCSVPKNREDFFLDLKNMDFETVIKKYCTVPLYIRIKKRLLPLLRRTK